jgi:lipopolysaccharide heptosyltransferase II
MTGAIRHIAILQLSGIGNFVMLTPTILNLRRLFPEARITLLVQDNGTPQVLEGLEGVTNIMVDPLLLNRPWRLLTYAVRLRKNPVLAGARIRVGHSYRALRRENLHWLLTHYLHLDETVHEVERNLAFLKVLGFKPTTAQPYFHLDESHRFRAAEFLQGIDDNDFVGMHCHSLAFKRWPVRHFAAVADWLVEEFQIKIILLGGPEETEVGARLLGQVKRPEEIINLVGKTTLKEAAALVQMCSLFVSDDSGLMHVAAALGTPVVGIFGCTDPGKNAPLSPAGTARVVRLNLSCSPCYRIDREPECSERTCLLDLDPKRAIAAIKESSVPFLRKGK